MNRRGFTVIEVLSVLSIIATLASILFPIFAHAREVARRGYCESNLQQIGMAIHLYAQDNSGCFPKKDNDFAALAGYVKQRDLFWCPSDSDKDASMAAEKPEAARHNRVVYSSYVLEGGLTTDDRRDSVIGGESQVFHAWTANVLRLDGTVSVVQAGAYKPIVKPLRRPEPALKPGPIPPVPAGP